MPKKNQHVGPPIAENPAHAYVVATFQKLRQNEIENFFKRATGSRSAATLMREILYWFMPCKQNAARPRDHNLPTRPLLVLPHPRRMEA